MKQNHLIKDLLRQTRISPENQTEKLILDHPEWKTGALYGKPRRGHPEGKVIFHIAEVLENVEKVSPDPVTRSRLRLITLVHDTFKFRVDKSLPKVGDNHHARIARAWAEDFIQDEGVLEVIETHDDAYNIWRRNAPKKDPQKRQRQLRELVDRLGSHLDLYHRFYWCDNHTGDKSQDNFLWFERVLSKRL